MKTIVLAATKGGAGKSTLAFNLAMEAAKHGTVFMVDMDPQGSLRGMCARRQGDTENPMILEGVDSVAGAVRSLHMTGYARDFLIVDTPGTLISTRLRDAVSAADAFVIPVQPSILDVEAQLAMTALIGQSGKGDKTVFVFNRVKANTKELDAIVKLMNGALPNPTLQIADRTEYARGAREGKAATEITVKAQAEMAALWQAVIKVLEDQNEGDAATGRNRGPEGAGEGRKQRPRVLQGGRS